MAEKATEAEAAALQGSLTGAGTTKPVDNQEPPGTITIDLEKIQDEPKGKVNPKDTSPPEGSKRWNEVYGKMKEYERKLEDVGKKTQQTDDLIGSMREHNQKLVSSIEKMTEVTQNAADTKTKDSKRDSLEQVIKETKLKRVEATKALDYDVADDLTDTIGDLRVQLKELDTPAKETQPKGKSLDPIAQKWINENKWFDDDPVMRDAAVHYEIEYSQQYPGESMDQILGRVKAQITSKFHLKEDVPSSGSTLVESGNSNGGKAVQGSTIRLSPDEVRLAEAFGVKVEDWAKHKAMANGGSR